MLIYLGVLASVLKHTIRDRPANPRCLVLYDLDRHRDLFLTESLEGPVLCLTNASLAPQPGVYKVRPGAQPSSSAHGCLVDLSAANDAGNSHISCAQHQCSWKSQCGYVSTELTLGFDSDDIRFGCEVIGCPTRYADVSHDQVHLLDFGIEGWPGRDRHRTTQLR